MSKQLSRSTSAITGNTTAKRNILHNLIDTLTDIKAASVFLDQYDKLVEKFRDCHLDYQATLTEKHRDVDQKGYFEPRMESYKAFQAEASGWLESMQEMEDEGLTGVGLDTSTLPRGTLGRLDPRAPPFKPENPVMTQAAERALFSHS